MPKIHVLDQSSSDAWDEWKKQQAKANDANKAARRAREQFESAAGDRQAVLLADGRRVNRVEEQRSGYRVPEKVITRWVLVPA